MASIRLLLVVIICYGADAYCGLSTNFIRSVIRGSMVVSFCATLACNVTVPEFKKPTSLVVNADQLLPDWSVANFITVAMVDDSVHVIDVSDDSVDIVLTFDDGPDSRSGSVNGTRQVLDILQELQLRAVFFIQSHARNDNDRYFRGMEERVGLPLVDRMHAEEHLVAVHTGVDGQWAHSWSNRHPRREAIGELGNDLQRCKSFIKQRTGSDPCYVRPPFGEYNRAVLKRYADHDLKMILWHIDSRDSVSTYDSQDIERHLRDKVDKVVARGRRQLVILFHDIDRHTYRTGNLLRYLKAIAETIDSHGLTADFDLTKQEIDQVLRDY